MSRKFYYVLENGESKETGFLVTQKPYRRHLPAFVHGPFGTESRAKINGKQIVAARKRRFR